MGTYRQRLDHDPSLPFRLSNLFNAHQPIPTSYGDVSVQHLESDAEPKTIQVARAECVEPIAPILDTGEGPMPSTILQECIVNMSHRKALKRRKLDHLFTPCALAAVAIVVEELATDLMETWRNRIREKLDLHGYNSKDVRMPSRSKETESGSYERCREEVPLDPSESLDTTAVSADRQQQPPSSPRASSQTGNIHYPLPALSYVVGCGLSDCTEKELYRFAFLQVQGADLTNLDAVFNVLKNRVEVIMIILLVLSCPIFVFIYYYI
jgi:hypothetical protein